MLVERRLYQLWWPSFRIEHCFVCSRTYDCFQKSSPSMRTSKRPEIWSLSSVNHAAAGLLAIGFRAVACEEADITGAG